MPSIRFIKATSLLLVLSAVLAALAQETPQRPVRPGGQATFGEAGPNTSRQTELALNSNLAPAQSAHSPASDNWSLLFVLVLSTFVGLGVIARVSRLLHTPLMSLTNAISAIAVVGAIIVTGGEYPGGIRLLGFVALVASTTNIVSGFLITDRMLKMFKQRGGPT
jgi:NAD(P) transhydrogenase subunit alpha